jgi:histidine triad (HIT) family protein
MSSCLFCKIIKGEAPSQKVYEDDRVFAFKDIRPQAPVHVLVCPRLHIPTLNDALPEHGPLLSHMFSVAKEIATQAAISEKGYRTVFNVNAGAGQTVFHLHLHVIGGKPLNWPP